MATTATGNASSIGRSVVLVGWAAKGIVYVALAWLVLQMALGTAPQQASTTGALEYIASSAPGKLALVLLGIGLLAYAVGRVLEVTVMAQPSVDGKEKAIGFVLAFVYLSLAISAFTIVGVVGSSSGSGSGSGSGAQQQGTAILLGLPAGQFLVAAVGIAVAALGIHSAYGGVQKKFFATLRQGEMTSTVRTWTSRIGMAAYVAKGAIFVLFGWFLVQAALSYNADEAATGLDGALRRVADETWGAALLVAVAVGLLAYGVFCEIEARYRRVGASARGTA